MISLIPLTASVLKIINNSYLFIGLFAIEFLVVGIVSTMAMNPLLSFKEIIRKIKQIIPFGLIFSFISTVIVYLTNMTASTILILLSIIAIIFSIITYLRIQSTISKIENPEEYTEKHIRRILYLLAIFCVTSYIGMEVPPFSVIPLWFGLCIPFIALLPGYICVNIINPYKDEIRIMERVGISVFISLVITSIVGLILVQIEHFLNMRHVSLILVVVTLIILLPLYYIRIKEKKTFVLFSNPTINKLFALMTIISLIAVIASGVLVMSGNNYNPTGENIFSQGNTSFEVKGIHETPDNEGYYNFTDGDNLNLTVNIQNKEHRDMNYKLKIEIINDTTNDTFLEEDVSVKDNKTKDVETNITMTTGKKDIKFTLFDDNNRPYKIRHLYVNVNDY